MRRQPRAMTTLLDPRHDPSPVDVVEPGARPDILLVCEHAGQAVPRALDGLGLPSGEIDRHIGWDIGAEALARDMAARLGCGLIVQRYSRLVIDCNRPPDGPHAMPEVSDGTAVPGNRGLDAAARTARVAEIFTPFAEACRTRVAPPVRAAFSIHSFEPVLAGVTRPWDIGFLYRSEESGGAHLARAMRKAHPSLDVGDNEPYTIEPETDWFIPACAEPAGLIHSLIEVRNDHLRDPASISAWADRLTTLITDFTGDTS